MCIRDSGVTDLHYENGKYYKLIPPPPEVTLIDLTEYSGPLEDVYKRQV